MTRQGSGACVSGVLLSVPVSVAVSSGGAWLSVPPVSAGAVSTWARRAQVRAPNIAARETTSAGLDG